MEGIAPLGTLDPQHAVAQISKALAGSARAFAFLARHAAPGPASLEPASITPLRAGCQWDRRKAADAPPVRR